MIQFIKAIFHKIINLSLTIIVSKTDYGFKIDLEINLCLS